MTAANQISSTYDEAAATTSISNPRPASPAEPVHEHLHFNRKTRVWWGHGLAMARLIEPPAASPGAA